MNWQLFLKIFYLPAGCYVNCMYIILHHYSYSTPQQPAEVQRDLEVFDVKVRTVYCKLFNLEKFLGFRGPIYNHTTFLAN